MFVRKLVYHMKKEDLTIKNGDDKIAFLSCCRILSVELAKVMFTKNEELLRIRGAENMLPIHIAAKHGHEKMMEFLLGVTKEKLAEEDDTKLKDLINKSDLSAAAAASFIQYPPSKIELHEEKDELVAVPPQGQDATTDSHMVVRKLVKYMTKEDLAIQNGDGYTAFCLLAASPWLSTATKIWWSTKDELSEKDRIELIRNLISRADLFDEALQLLKERPKLAMDNLGYEWRRETALHILAGTPMMPPNLANQNQQGILKRYFNTF
ncbi:hypothetical protein Pint_11193 [Pistacia integerrima]|uniref:Uncharacterized protein n=1 Tax=Pistacia integerrima TaxID=434235 RepID=A0ACC0XHW7_9ROSI|nr:hypothetical protein Pint_11193 [Pistacia integerrima]